MLSILRRWLPFALLSTILCALVYVAVQQDIRLGANDLPAQLALDAAHALDAGADPARVIPATTAELSFSLQPFVIVFDAAGEPLASSARLDGDSLAPPRGVLLEARNKGESRITWQPEPGVRLAIVSIATKGPTHLVVLAGASLREREARIEQLTGYVLLAWMACLVTSLLAIALWRRP